jgi:hypothetical protein
VGIALVAVAQQAVMFCRAGVRVALFGGEIALVGRFWPVVAASTVAAPVPAAPVPAAPVPADVLEPYSEPPSPS